MSARCERDLDLQVLVAYWTGELGAEEDGFEEHLMGCAACTVRLSTLAALGDAVASLAAKGRIFASVTLPHLERARAAGLQLRTYRLAPEQSVHCTIAPDDDANVIHLAADFAGVDRVDLEQVEVEGGVERHGVLFEDLAVDRAAGEAVLLYPGELIRPLGRRVFRLRLLAQGPEDPRCLGTYTLDHAPWTG